MGVLDRQANCKKNSSYVIPSLYIELGNLLPICRYSPSSDVIMGKHAVDGSMRWTGCILYFSLRKFTYKVVAIDLAERAP